MQNLAQVKAQATSVLQSSTANSQLSSVIDNSIALSLMELTRRHDFSCCSKLVPVSLSPGVRYDRRGGFSFTTKATISSDNVTNGAYLSFSTEVAKLLTANLDNFTLGSQAFTTDQGRVLHYDDNLSNMTVAGAGEGLHLFVTGLVWESALNPSPLNASGETAITITWNFSFKKLRYIFNSNMVPVELVTFANLHGFNSRTEKLNLVANCNTRVVSVNSEQFTCEGKAFDGYLYGTVEVPTWDTPEGQLILKASIDFVYWNAVTHGNFLVGVFLPRQEGALDPPEQQKEAAIQGIIVDDSYLERQSFSMHGIM